MLRGGARDGTLRDVDPVRLTPDQLAHVDFAHETAAGRSRVTINGVLGPRGDGYFTGARMSGDEAGDYHAWQIRILRDAGAQRVPAMTMTYPEEAAGVVQAAAGLGMPVVASFTVETDGRLPSGMRLADAIEQVDETTAGAAQFFMVNCAHPTHIADGLGTSAANTRIGGLRVNASTLSHAQLEAATDLDDGDPTTLAHDTASLRDLLPSVQLLGGCRGTDHRHVAQIITAWNNT